MQCDLLIIGTGIAALSLVFHLKELKFDKKIIIVSDDKFQYTNSYKAQGGLALEMGNNLKKSSHITDTIRCGIINDFDNTSQILNEAEFSLDNLIKNGLIFETNSAGKLLKRKEAGHSHRRILFHSDSSGKFIQDFLFGNIRDLSNVTLIDNKFCYKLIKNESKCVGAKFIDKKYNTTESIYATRTVLATGGCGALYKFTSNSSNTIGSGVSLAEEIGAEISNMEFIQFHPTVFVKFDKTILLSEALRGEGAKIVSDKDGILEGLELLTRDKLSRILFDYINSGHKLFLDCTKISESTIAKFDFIKNSLQLLNVDIKNELIPIQPAAHYMCGGIITNTLGQTSIENLFAIGEVANTGLHGANRLASNSLTEAITVSHLLAKDLISAKWSKEISYNDGNEIQSFISIDFSEKIDLLRNIMWEKCGLKRDNTQLIEFKNYINSEFKSIQSLPNLGYSGQYYKLMLGVCKLIVESSIKREENVGTFWKQTTQ